ncbi:2-oxoglutarate:acceptor oxidoreductase [Helicobacter monodelphidis]|uniref:4Fe-4S binding protein n=1 Tax=Helicobacter sp. 15-1451 TaxID=2004995 RepID=UPI000DCF02DC|nr:4Fe-4S dicluster domain-containing protein [Helicobacter sp. 15-1451]RAX57819.1 2-oxoglutarate:acceptor oxidoreductase [Helicobacter sp. 15-1451]
MAKMVAPANTPVWVDESRCKACDLCVSLCPSGTLAMQSGSQYVLGKIVKVIEANSCIGCNDCELHCPDFAIHVAEKSEFKFAKLTEESKNRAQKIKENRFMVIGE